MGFFEWPYTPTFRGFDSHLGYLTGGESYFEHKSFNGGYDLRFDRQASCGKDCSEVLWSANGTYSTHLFVDRAEEIISRSAQDENLFLYLATQAVHCPAQVPLEYSAPYNFSDHSRNIFAGMLAALDEGVGNITAALAVAGRASSTLWVVTSDNGAPTTGCGGAQGGQNWPLRGGKCSAWEGGLRATSFVNGPGVRAGIRVQDIAHAVDWGPTMLSLVARGQKDDGGVVVEGGELLGFPLDGVDQSHALTTATSNGSPAPPATPPARDVVLLEADPHASPLDGPTWGGDQHHTPYYAVRKNGHKLILGDPGQPGIVDAWYCTGPPCPESHDNKKNASAAPKLDATSILLFDLESDPSEAHNIAASHPDVVQDLSAIIREYNRTAASSMQQGLPDEPAAAPSLHNGTVAPWK